MLNSLYRIPTPYDRPLRAGLPDVYRFVTFPICARCDRQWPKEKPLVLNVPKFVLSGGVLVRGPGIADSRVMEEFMVLACNMGSGCWRECTCGKQWNMKCRKYCVETGAPDASGFGLARPGDCACICTCKPGCGNQGIHPCQCGYVKLFHNMWCPVGGMKRTNSFVTALVRRRLTHKGLVGR